jgi:hypothetical protein
MQNSNNAESRENTCCSSTPSRRTNSSHSKVEPSTNHPTAQKNSSVEIGEAGDADDTDDADEDDDEDEADEDEADEDEADEDEAAVDLEDTDEAEEEDKEEDEDERETETGVEGVSSNSSRWAGFFLSEDEEAATFLSDFSPSLSTVVSPCTVISFVTVDFPSASHE